MRQYSNPSRVLKKFSNLFIKIESRPLGVGWGRTGTRKNPSHCHSYMKLQTIKWKPEIGSPFEMLPHICLISFLTTIDIGYL